MRFSMMFLLLCIKIIRSLRPLRRLRSGRFLGGLLEVVIALWGWVIELMSAVVGARQGMLITCSGRRAWGRQKGLLLLLLLLLFVLLVAGRRLRRWQHRRPHDD